MCVILTILDKQLIVDTKILCIPHKENHMHACCLSIIKTKRELKYNNIQIQLSVVSFNIRVGPLSNLKGRKLSIRINL